MAQEEVGWAHLLRPDWVPYIYSAESPPEPGYRLIPPMQRGREAVVYLAFIVDHYDMLPQYAAFVHGSSHHWHNDMFESSTPATLDHLRLDVVDRSGYVNLRCTHQPNCPISINPLAPTQQDIDSHDPRAYFADIYQTVMNVSKKEVPEHLGAACCSQFVVSRQRILERPLEDYVRMRDWALESGDMLNSYGVGWVFESLWHVIFGMPPIHCPEEKQCACDLYGMCEG